MFTTTATAPTAIDRLANRIRRRVATPDAGTHDGLVRELVARYSLTQARRLAGREVGRRAVAAAAERVREAVEHAVLAADARRSPVAATRLWQDVRAEAVAAGSDFARLLARGLGLTAEDVLQEGFIKFLTAIPGFDPRRATFRTFFRRVIRHHILDLARRAKARPGALSLGSEDAGVDPPDTRHGDPAGGGGVWAGAVEEAVADVCGRLLEDGLEADRVRAFQLRRLGGLRLAEVAARIGRCVAWVYRADLAVARAFAERFRARYPGLVREIAPQCAWL